MNLGLNIGRGYISISPYQKSTTKSRCPIRSDQASNLIYFDDIIIPRKLSKNHCFSRFQIPEAQVTQMWFFAARKQVPVWKKMFTTCSRSFKKLVFQHELEFDFSEHCRSRILRVWWEGYEDCSITVYFEMCCPSGKKALRFYQHTWKTYTTHTICSIFPNVRETFDFKTIILLSMSGKTRDR